MPPENRPALHAERRAVLQAEHVSPLDALLAWLRHPIVVFLLPLTLLLAGPKIYDAISFEPARPIQESQLQEVASLLDDIYATLVNMTFMPPTAVKRGPHQINVTAIPCRRDPAALRFMEIMPLVDHTELGPSAAAFEADWFYGGEFIDYRDPDHLHVSCDPYRAEGTWHQVKDGQVQLTEWGTGGWNGDRTHVLLYDTKINAIQVYEGEHIVSLINEEDSHRRREHYAGPILYRHSISQPLAALRPDDFEWETWFDAPTFLRRLLHAYQSLELTPWETSNREDGWGVNTTIAKDLLRKNGWPQSFDSAGFNADLIRARHISPERGPAEAAFQAIAALTGPPEASGWYPPGNIEHTRNSTVGLDQSARRENNEEIRWYWLYRAASDRWALENQEIELHAAQKTYELLCPNGVCIAPGNRMLWNFFYLEQVYDKAQRAISAEEACREVLRYDTCMARHKSEARWLHLAYTESKADAVAHCTATTDCTLRCKLLPQPSLEEQIMSSTSRLHDRLLQHQILVKKTQQWHSTIPKHLTQALEHVQKDIDRWNGAAQSEMESIERLRTLLGSGNREEWQRCMDEETCANTGML